jgi:hypothetical protein
VNDFLIGWLALRLFGRPSYCFFSFQFFISCGDSRSLKIAVSAGIGCAVQLIVTPWFFSARPTAQNPSGNIAQRAVAAIVWSSLTALLFFYYIQRDWPRDSHANAFRACLFGITIVFGIAALVLVRVFSRHRGNS